MTTLLQKTVEQLHEASNKGDISGVKKILKSNGAKWAHARDSQGRTGLHKAIKAGQIETIRVLLSSSEPEGNPESVRSTDNCQRTPLHYAARIENAEVRTEIWNELINAGADQFARDNVRTPLKIANCFNSLKKDTYADYRLETSPSIMSATNFLKLL